MQNAELRVASLRIIKQTVVKAVLYNGFSDYFLSYFAILITVAEY